uniref:Uncharacterized protein n=1 Tax=Chromera velia CCMP2878 TaxID=1169474 RepID=A0A0G4I9Q7_9ALVE|eukprot:Cvel_12228.t1-p1 / transcript=Cvel_12228.t1 / gene=Cvel_12228 / organism=Chromera_velia_CCMP2878 / gene_product=hypothetical protein / transcript_product=hypothetical protein / location=Cvel_scaffold791:58057-61982(-) / protein_length=166 / sequence_SO=supercontig / SO=protein_coding / is_pseudo=false
MPSLRGCCCGLLSLRTGMIVLFFLHLFGAAAHGQDGLEAVPGAIVSSAIGVLGIVAVYMLNARLLTVVFWFSVVHFVFLCIAVLLVILVVAAVLPPTPQPLGPGDNVALQVVSMLVLAILILIDLYVLLVMRSLIKVIEAGGTGEEKLTAEEVKEGKGKDENAPLV